MKKYIIFLFGIFFFIVACENSNKRINNQNTITIDLVNKSEDFNLKKIFSDIEVIPLESEHECQLMSPTKAVVKDRNIFIMDFSRGLFMFDSNGNFVRQIGTQGKGPGEWLEARDFFIDQEGNILILDYMKILKYNMNGEFLSVYKELNFRDEIPHFNSYQFTIVGNSDIYLWGGTLGIKDFGSEKYAMYLFNNECIEAGYFPVKFSLSDKQSRFIISDSVYLISPTLGNDTIYSINKDGVEAKYFVKFNEPARYADLLADPHKAKLNILNSSNVSYDIDYPLENKNWLHFMYKQNQDNYLAFYNKTEAKTYVTRAFMWSDNPEVGNMVPYNFSFSSDDSFWSLMPAADYLKIMKGLDKNSIIPYKLFNDSDIGEYSNFIVMKYRLR